MTRNDRSKELLEGYRQSLPDWENLATVQSAEKLHGYESAFRTRLEAGVLVPCLGTKAQNNKHLKLCGLFLKRVLNDLRCVWLSIQQGYTSQAATIGASLFESTHVVKLIAYKEERADLFDGIDLAEKLPWRVDEMCQELAKDEIAAGQWSISFDEVWKLDYSKYRWFCEIKHTTLRVALLDAGTVASNEGYVIMASPDRREEFIGMKKLVCIFALLEARQAIEKFAKATGVGSDATDEKKFRDMMEEVNDFVSAQISDKASLKIPFGLKDTVWGRKNLRPLNCLK